MHLARRDSGVVSHLAQAAVVARGGQPPYHLGDVIPKHLSAGAPALRLEVHLEGELPQAARAAVSLRVLFAVRLARLTMIRKISETVNRAQSYRVITLTLVKGDMSRSAKKVSSND